jgi:uncharacterized protein (TIGR03437 family)
MKTSLTVMMCIAASSALAQTSGPFQQNALYVVHSATRRAPQTPETGLAAGSLCDINTTGLYQPFGSLATGDPVTLHFRAPGASGERELSVLAARSSFAGTPTQFTALIPPDTPVGQGEVVAVSASGSSFSTQVWIAATDFGIFTKAGAGYDAAVAQVTRGVPRSVGLTTPVQAGEWVTLWGTGLGSGTASSVLVEVAGISIAPAYAGAAPGLAGVDQINFQFPAGVPDDCYIPIAVKAGGRAGNTPSIAVAGTSGACHHRLGLSPDALATLDQGGSVPLSQSWVHSDVVPDPGTPASYRRYDTVSLDFMQYDAAEVQVATGVWADLVSRCQVNLDGGVAGAFLQVPPMDVGTLVVVGPGGVRIAMDGSFGHYYTTPSDKTYTLDALPASSFVPGPWSVQVSGGKDVAPFQAGLRIPPALQWINRATVSPVSRGSDLVLKWDATGYTENEWMQGSIGMGTASAICQAPATAGSIVVPATLIAQLPAATAGAPMVQLLLTPVNRIPLLYQAPMVRGGPLPGVATFSYLEMVFVELR